MDRRLFLKIATAAGAGFASGCETRMAEKLIPYLAQPQEIVTGVADFYATTCRECPAGCGTLVRTREGRAIKLEGNPDDPLTGGALCARGQAALQGLYNPDRPVKPLLRGQDGRFRESTWEEALASLHAAIASAASPESIGLLTGETSDSDAELIWLFAEALGARAPVNLRLFGEAPVIQSAESLFGITAVPEYHPEAADLLVSFGADFAETWGNPVAMTAGFTRSHAYRDGARCRVIYAGPRLSNTASVCDEWIRLAPGREAAALRIVADELLLNPIWISRETAAGVQELLAPLPLLQAEKVVGEAAARLRGLSQVLNRAASPLVIASGLGADAATAHSLALLVTWLTGGKGVTFSFHEPARPARGDSLDAAAELLDDAASGALEVLLVHAANPAFLLPAKSEAIEKAKFVACFTTQFDETAALADLVIPINHPLESWGFHAASDERIGVIQPAMKAIFGTRDFGDILISLAASLPGNLAAALPWQNNRAFVESRLEAMRAAERAEGTPPNLDELKRRGGLNRTTTAIDAALKNDAAVPLPESPVGDGITALFFPHPYLYDGRGADKPWLQEVPETSTSATWGCWAEVNPETAATLGVGKGDSLKLSRESGEITVPVLVTPQVMADTVAVPIGQGHWELGRWAKGRGANPLELAGTGVYPALAGLLVTVQAVKGTAAPILAAGSQFQGSRGLALAVPLAEAGSRHDEHRYDQTLYPKHEHPVYDWSMVIDLDACVGCGACSVACYAENNLGITGPTGLAAGREMAWIRIEKYADGDDVRFIPVLCQHCHHAPCEPVCPVNAAYHTDEGTNAQIYNRCVGTRYCSNNCPYKVRRFNFFDYKFPPPLHLQLNPDITVRERGVMEKCTFCLQRIKDAKEAAQNEGRIVADGEVQPACAQTCPAKAITFGNFKDAAARVSVLSRDPRSYRLLEELGTRPSVFYLKKVLRKEGGEA